MEKIGTVRELWRYPVKSMAGERIERCEVAALGVAGDRGWALRDEKAGEVRGAKKLGGLMRCRAIYLEEPANGRIPSVEITLPGGEQVRTTDTESVNRRISEFLGRPVTIWPLQPPENRDFYRRGAPDNPDMNLELREIFGRVGDEPLPDLTNVPPEIFEFTSPLGTYFDVFPLHILTTASLEELARRNPHSIIDVRRFRPNIVVETRRDLVGFVEADWVGRTLVIGDVRIRLEIPCMRCVMPTLEQEGLPKDPSVLRTIVRDAEQNFGSYATTAHPGRIALGDDVLIE